ncbi:unnamed protein product [Oreochromis niloticus]|nr:unnamed protein product [Mustela putorius furo]
MSDPVDNPDEIEEELQRVSRLMTRICGCTDPKVVSTGLAAIDAILQKAPQLRQLPQLFEAFDSLAPLKEELRASTLAQRVLNAASAPTTQTRKWFSLSSPLPRESEAVRVGTLKLTTAPPSTHSSSPPLSSCTAQRTEMVEATDFDDDERRQVLLALWEDELRWKPSLISEEELTPAAPPRTSCSPSPPRSDFTSPASFLARMWADDEEIAAMSPSVSVASASIVPTSRKNQRQHRRCTALPPGVSDCVSVSHNPSIEKSEMCIDSSGPETMTELCSETESTVFSCLERPTTEIMEPDLCERQQAACTHVEEELRGKPWLTTDCQHVFRGTRLALGGPRSCQGPPPLTSPTANASASVS